MKLPHINTPIGQVGPDGKVKIALEWYDALSALPAILPVDPHYIDDLPPGNTLARVNSRVSEILAVMEADYTAKVAMGEIPS